jgi:small GTP-binding protein
MSDYDYTLKINLLGDGAVGKTSLLLRYTQQLFRSESRLTIGVEFLSKTMEIDSKRIKLQIWDIGGQEQFRFLMTTYVKGSNGALLLFDLTRRDTFESLPSWLDEMRKENPYDYNFPLILIGNKADLSKLREVSTEEAIGFAKFENCLGYIETSAKTGENVEKTFELLVVFLLIVP